MEFAICLLYLILFCVILYKIKFFKLERIPRFAICGLFLFKVVLGLILFNIYSNTPTDRSLCDIFRYFDDGSIIYQSLFTHPADFFKLIFRINCDTPYFYETYYCHFNVYEDQFLFSFLREYLFITNSIAILDIFTFGYYFPTMIILIFISFSGTMAFVKLFSNQQPQKQIYFLLAFYLTPSFALWSSGLLKEPFLIFAMGFLLLYFQNFSKKTPLYTLIFPAFLLFVLLYNRLYLFCIFLILLPPYILSKTQNLKKTLMYYGFALIIITPLILWGVSVIFDKNIFNFLYFKRQDFIALAEITQAGSRIPMQEIQPQLIDFIKDIPNALYHSILLPLPDYRQSPLVFFNGIENFILILCLLFPCFFYKKAFLKNVPLFIFSLLFILINLLIIGWTTPVVGAIVRYRCLLAPFYFGLLINLTDFDQLNHTIKSLF